MSIKEHIHFLLEKARKFQHDLLNSFPKRKETILQLIEALASRVRPTSVVELSQTTPFQRTYSNIHKAIDALSPDLGTDKGLSSASSVVPSTGTAISHPEDTHPFVKQTRIWTDIFTGLIPQETTRPFKLFAIDATSTARPYAHTLNDRTFVHQAAQLGSPVTIGLQASVIVAIPEKVEGEAKWTLPLSVERIPSNKTPSETAAKQLIELHRLWPNDLCVVAVDSGYTHLMPFSANQILIARGRIDRVGRQPYVQGGEPAKRGRPKKYTGTVFRFADNIPAGDEGGPNEELEYESVCNGHPVFAFLSRWNNVYVHGQTELVDVVKCEIFLKDDLLRTLLQSPYC